jgi:hypothetical protein
MARFHQRAFLLALAAPVVACVAVKDATPTELGRRSDDLYQLTARVETFGSVAGTLSASLGGVEYVMTDRGGGRFTTRAKLPCRQNFQVFYVFRPTDATLPTIIEPPGATPTMGGFLKRITPAPSCPGDSLSTVYQVNSTDFVSDGNPGDGICDTNPPGSGLPPVCTLRAAIEESNAGPGPATIKLPAGTYATDRRAFLYFTPEDNVTIEGTEPGVVLDAQVSIFSPAGLDFTVTLRNLTVRGVRSSVALHLDRVNSSGATGELTDYGVTALGPLTIENSTIENNGDVGVRVIGATARIFHSLVAGNHRGGVDCVPGAGTSTELQILDSTITGNQGEMGISGVTVRDGCHVTLRNATIARNAVMTGVFGPAAGGLTVAPGGTATLSNTILDENTSLDPVNADCAFSAPGVANLQSFGFNLIHALGTCTFSRIPGRADLTGVGAGLGPLADNGGPTQTLTLMSGSPARRAGAPDDPNDAFLLACFHVDQRGTRRRVRCDIGAVQVSR